MYLSIDVGIKNLAYVILDKENKIIEWNVVELCDKTTNSKKISLVEIATKLEESLDNILSKYNIQTVIIENQIGPNAIRMKSIQGMITMFCVSKRIYDIQYWNASNKLKKYIKGKSSYTERKKASVIITRLLLIEHYSQYLDFFNKHKKKDDLADCFLQLLDYLSKDNKLTHHFFEKSIDEFTNNK
jgi:Holliday junction resolvasome RuvABC endonuclease subunit